MRLWASNAQDRHSFQVGYIISYRYYTMDGAGSNQTTSKYSKASDTYALGMVLWEIASERIPYWDFADNTLVLAMIRRGEQEGIPENTPQRYSDAVRSYWHMEPSERTTPERLGRDVWNINIRSEFAGGFVIEQCNR